MEEVKEGFRDELLNVPSLTQKQARGNSGTVQSANSAYFPALDGLRAIAFLMVFGVHYLQLPWGWAGVDVFFVLSGFLITGILFDTRDDIHRVRNFYIRRTLRIFPLYYGLILLLVVSYPLFKWQWNWLWLVWPMYIGNYAWYLYPWTHGRELAMLADAQPLSRTFPGIVLYFGHFWSLCAEEQFYLVWPWLVFWIKDRRKLLYVCIASIVACPLLRVLASHTLAPIVLHANTLLTATPFRIDALLLGGLIALVRRGSQAHRILPIARTFFYVLMVVALLWLVLDPEAHRRPQEYIYPTWAFTWGLSFIDIFSGCVVVMALEYRSWTFRILNRQPLRWLGRISYGAYVFHDIPHTIYFKLAMRSQLGHWRIVSAVLALTCTILISWASFRWFESRFIDLKERWTR